MTPIADRLDHITNGNRLATFHGQTGGEWDPLRHTSYRRRARLTAAGWLGARGEPPDVFADLIRRQVGQECEPDPIAWFLAEAHRATAERAPVALRASRLRLARRHGCRTYWYYRKARHAHQL